MALALAHCPADAAEVAEAYAMDVLSGTDLEAFEAHLLICARCRAQLG